MREYMTTRDIVGPLLLIERVVDVKYGELVELEFPDGTRSLGNVLEVNGGVALVQAFEGTRGANPSGTKARFLGRSLELGVSRDMLGRVFDGLGRPNDGGPEIIPDKRVSIYGSPINPTARDFPDDFIQTGISAIDGLNPLVRGRVDGRAVDGDALVRNDLRSAVVGATEAIEDASEHVSRNAELERAAEEARLRAARVRPARALERLHERDVAIDLEHVAERTRAVGELELDELAVLDVDDALDQEQRSDDVASGHVLTHQRSPPSATDAPPALPSATSCVSISDAMASNSASWSIVRYFARAMRSLTGASKIAFSGAPPAHASSAFSWQSRIVLSSRSCSLGDENWSSSRKAFCCRKSSRIDFAVSMRICSSDERASRPTSRTISE